VRRSQAAARNRCSSDREQSRDWRQSDCEVEVDRDRAAITRSREQLIESSGTRKGRVGDQVSRSEQKRESGGCGSEEEPFTVRSSVYRWTRERERERERAHHPGDNERGADWLQRRSSSRRRLGIRSRKWSGRCRRTKANKSEGDNCAFNCGSAMNARERERDWNKSNSCTIEGENS
jgi:hypothetical protein